MGTHPGTFPGREDLEPLRIGLLVSHPLVGSTLVNNQIEARRRTLVPCECGAAAFSCRATSNWCISALYSNVGAFWPAPGSEDTELGVLMELEVRHGEAS